MKTNGIWCVLFTLMMLHACNKPAADFNSNPEFYKSYISGFTAGVIPTGSDIRVILINPKSSLKKGQRLDEDLFDISPSIDGKVVALSSNTIAFVPSKKLKPDTQYQVSLKLSELVKVPDDL